MSNCIKIVNAMPQADQDALLTRLENYQAVGMTPKQAQLEAAKETLKRLEGEVVQQSARELVETPAFKAWFKDSKVVDENGKPLAVYHGTKNAPSEFTASRIGSASTMFGDYEVERHGIFAAEDPELADEYANQGERPTNQTVMPLYMAINNPLDTVDGQYTDVIWNGIEEAAGALGSENPYRTARFIGDLWGRGELWKLFDADENNDPAWNIALFKKAGYDGLRILERSEGDVENTAAWVAFEPTQVKSATGNNGDFDATNPNISKSQRSPLGFYSALSEGIAAMPTKQAMAGAWMSQIKGLVNKGAVKADEIEWSGLEDWLKLQEGKVSKEQITEFLDANGVQVQETVLGAPEKSFDIYRQERNGRRGAYIMSYGTMEDAEAWVDDRDPDEGEFMIEELADEDNPTGTKYEQYTLPGGKNYREVLLTLPDGKEAKAKKRRYQEIADEMANTTPERYAELREERAEMSKTGIQQYNSPHWDAPNVLAHLRLDDRTDADGKRVLFVEEIQSDWGQQGKKKGFVGTAQGAAKANNMTDAEFADLSPEDQAFAISETFNSSSVSTPNAPFVGKTDGWLNLALKRVITMAVQGGYAKVAFVNGEQSADRYDLSKHIDKVSYEKDEEGNYAITATDKVGKQVFRESNASLERVEEVLGKDIAIKVKAKEGEVHPRYEDIRILSGLDLKTGGEGMKTFYNSIVPNAVKALLKKLGGGQMEMVQLGAPEWGVFDQDGSPLETGFGSRQRAEGVAKDYPGSIVKNEGGDSQPGFQITPAMREKVSAGLPLFSKRDTEAAEAAGFDTSKVWFHGTTAKDFKAFRQGKGGVNELGSGIYFTDKPMYAEAWAGRLDMGGRIIPAYLKQGDIFDLGAKRDLTALAKRLKAMNPVTDAERQAKQIRADKSVTEWTPEEQRIVNDASMDLWRTWLLESDADLAKQIGRGDLNVWLARANYIGAKNDNSQIPGQVVIFDARNIRSPWAKFNPKKVDSANILHSIRDASGVDQPDVLIGSPLGAAQNHPDYAAAKGGYIQAALRLAKSLVNQELIAKVKELIGDARPVIAPVIAVEASGRNKIPRAAAELLAARLGLDTATSIGQRNSPKRTGMDGIDRLFASPVFDGEVVAGQDYLLLDDTITQGGTFAALASHIQAAGGRVLGSVALTGKQYSATLKPTAATLQKLREKFSDIEPEFRAITGYGFDALTESEARYIANYKPADSLRVRVLAEGRRTRQFVDSPAADRVSKSTRQTDTEEFKTWSQGLDLVEAGEEYAGGPAVFTAYHGTTHSDITQFERMGQSEGFLGKGPYFTTDPEDASENYAGIGPDLTSRIEREKEDIYDNDDPQSQAYWLRDYFEVEPGELAFYIKANQPGFDADSWQDDSDAIGLLWERFAEPAANLAATKSVKGDTDGLMMKAYVRMSNPADTTGNSAPLIYERTENEDGDTIDETGTAVDWIMAAREVGERYGIGNSMEEHIDDVLSEGGDVSMKTVFDSARKRLSESFDEEGELLSSGAIFAEIAEEAGYDGVIMDAGLHFGPRKGFGGVKLLGMKGVKTSTLHMVPFSATQVKSATGNSGAFDPANPDIRKSVRDNQQTLDEEKKDNFYVDLRKRLASGGLGNYPGPELHTALLGLERQGVHLREAVVRHDSGRWDGSTIIQWRDTSPLKDYVTTGFKAHTRDGIKGFYMPIVPSQYVPANPTNKDILQAISDGHAATIIEIHDRPDGAVDFAIRGPKPDGEFHRDFAAITKGTGLSNAEGEEYLQVPVGAAVTKSWMREAFRRYAMLHNGALPDVLMARATGANPNMVEKIRTGAEMELRFSARDEVAYSIRPEASRFDDMVYKMQNKMIDTKRVIESITATVGQIADDLNVYLQEELFHGRAAKRVSDFGKQELKPLMEQIGRDGYTIADVEEYLQARHAPEANQVIAQRNPNEPGLQDGGSGMTNAAAAAYMAGLSAADAQKLAGIAAQVDAIIKQTRQLYVDYKLESQDTVDAWERMFQNYIPLQREDKEGRMGIGQGFSVKGKETKGRTGSTRKVVDVLANIALQREKLIVRGEKNRVATALVGLAIANPDPDLWSVGPPPSTRVYDPKTNTVVDRVDPMYKSRDEVLVAKVPDANGVIKEMAVVFVKEDPRALRMVTALKNLDAANLEGLLAVSAKITRYFSSVNTQFNPLFGIVNLVRDVQGAMINLGETPLAGKRLEIAKNTLSALAGIYADMRAERNGTVGTSPWAQLFEEFELEGGQTGFRDLFKTSADRAEALQKILTPDAWMDSKLGKIFTANGKLKVPMREARKGAGWIFDWLSDYNGSMENAVRLSAYKAAKDQGMSMQQAASLAKNLTVNFNRKGQAGQQVGALYAFFNAAMQGTARMGQTLFTMQPGKPKTIRLSSTGKKVVYGGVLLGATQAMLLAAAGFGDDDPPEFLRERALIIPVGGKSYISIPMPLGFHVIPGIGRHAAEFALSGFEKPQKRIVSMIGMFMDAFNPIGNAGLSMQTLAPTALDPLVALRENKDWTGKPIARTSSNKAIPGHTQFKDTATAPAKWLAEAINWVTGGNDYVAGVLSPTPDQIDYLAGQVTGGVGRELSKVEQTAKAMVTGEELPTFKMPLVGRFFGNADSQASQASAFYDNVNKLNELETEVKGMQKDGKAAEAALILRGRPDAYLIARANVAERQVQRLRREKRELIKKGAERSAIKAKEAQITETMKRLNAAMAQ